MKNILLVSHQSDLSGGPISLYLLARGLDKIKYKVFYVVPSPGLILSKLKESGIETFVLEKKLSKNRLLRKLKRQKYPLKISRFIKENKIDLVHANTIFSDFASQAGSKAGVPVVWHIREDLEDSKYDPILRIINRLSYRVIAISHWVKNVLTRIIPEEKIAVVHNGLDLSQFEPNIESKVREEFNISEDTRLVGTIGSLEERKGIDFFLQAAAKVKSKVPKIKFLIVGKSLYGQEAYLDQLKDFAKELGVEKDVIFCGARDDIPQIIKALDVVVVPSRSEPFGRVVIEGMAIKKPVVASDCGGIPEIIENGIHGVLFPVSDVDRLASDVISILENKDLAVRLGEEGRKRVEERFSIEKHVEEVEKVYEEILG